MQSMAVVSIAGTSNLTANVYIITMPPRSIPQHTRASIGFRRCDMSPEAVEQFQQFSVELKSMCDYLSTETQTAPRSVNNYWLNARIVAKQLIAGDYSCMPREITQESVRYLLDYWEESSFAPKTRTSYLHALRTVTDFYDNPAVRKMKIHFPDTRSKVDWITEKQADILLNAPMTPYEELIVHCELCLGLRRIEVLRLKESMIHDTYMDVIGKGPLGGKLRAVPFHPDTPAILERASNYRNSIISVARGRKMRIDVPDQVIIYGAAGVLSPYAEKGGSLDEMLAGVSERVGFHFSHHTLRRTFGRIMYFHGMDIVTLAKIYGHSSTATTLLYIGANLDDMSAAMKKSPLRKTEKIYENRC